MERKRTAVITSGNRQLTVKAFRADTDAHRRDFKSTAKRFIPEKDITVQAPVVIVGCSAVVRFAALEGTADLHQENGSQLLGNGIFTLFRSQIGVTVLQLLGGDEGDIFFQRCMGAQLREDGPERFLGGTDGVDNAAYRPAEVFRRPFTLGDDLFPVPLVDVQRMQIIQLLITADGVHIGVQPGSGFKTVIMQRLAFPFGE